MAYSRAQDFSDDWESRRPSSSSRSYSTSSRSMGQPSRSQSTASSASRGRSSNAAQYEAAAQTYHAELEKFLVNVLAKEAAEGPLPQRVSARQKLSRLNNLQFHELAMDVYDELMRRNMNDKQVPFLPVREEFHPRRNQARQKLATLSTPRFQDLASDVYHELTRRYPASGDSYRPPVPPIPSSAKSTEATKPQASQATNIVPVKGTINVEAVELSDDERAYMSDGHRGNMDDRTTFLSDHSGSNTPSYRGMQSSKASPPPSSKPMKNGHMSNTSAGSESNFQSLDSLMADLGNMVAGKGSSPTDLDDRERKLRLDRETTERMRADYEERIAGLTKRCQQLEADLAMARERKGSMSSDMEADVAQLRKKDQERQNRLKQLQEEYNRLDDRYRQLELEHRKQKDAVDEVKEETSQLLEQIKILSSKNDDLRIEKERAEAQVKQLSEEIKEWQEKYEKSRLELRTLKAMSMDGSDIPNQNISNQEFLQPTRSGVISHDHILAYQVAINDLLKAARSSKPSQILPVMQTIILTCKAITEQVETHEARGDLPSSTQNSLYNLKTQVSTALMNLLSAVKTHAAGMGISPVCLVDASAANMTKVIVDLAKLLGISPSQGDAPVEMNGIKKNGSLAAAAKPAVKPGDMLDPEELSSYLKGETDHIVQSIQNLLAALRSPSQSGQVYGIITSITDIVSALMQASEKTLSSTAGFRFRKRGNLVLSDLDRCKQKVIRIRDTSFDRSPETASANAKRDLAKEAYEIAKYTKELINIFES